WGRFNSPTITRTICVRRCLFILTPLERILLRARQRVTQRIHKLAQREAKTKSAMTLLIHCVEVLKPQSKSNKSSAKSNANANDLAGRYRGIPPLRKRRARMWHPSAVPVQGCFKTSTAADRSVRPTLTKPRSEATATAAGGGARPTVAVV